MADRPIERAPSTAVRESDARGLSTVNRPPPSEQFRVALDRARENNEFENRRIDQRRDGRRAEARDDAKAKPNENAQKNQVEREKQAEHSQQSRQTEKKTLEGGQSRLARVGRDGKNKGGDSGGSSDQQKDEKKKQLGSAKELDPSRQPFNISHMMLQPGFQNPVAPAPAATPAASTVQQTETAALLQKFVESMRIGKVGSNGHEVHLKIRGSGSGSGIEIRLRKQGQMLLAVLRADSDSLQDAERIAENFRVQAKERGLDFDAIDVEMI